MIYVKCRLEKFFTGQTRFIFLVIEKGSRGKNSKNMPLTRKDAPSSTGSATQSIRSNAKTGNFLDQIYKKNFFLIFVQKLLALCFLKMY